MNQYSSEFQETLWWAQPQQHLMEFPAKISTSSSSSKHKNFMFHPQKTATFSFNLNNEEEDNQDLDLNEHEKGGNKLYREVSQVCKEPMFEKPLTPSDVGKLNRLVIPKQHAEKYFPLSGGGESGDKGMLLSFEDELGKSWRFRYSYWNSSQSYVLTKGWSRFVKEKRLDAGDVVLFQRHRTDLGRIFIGWRRRNATVGIAPPPTVAPPGNHDGWGTRVLYSGRHPYLSQPLRPLVPYQSDHNLPHAGSRSQNQTTSSGNSRKLRLFGVNLECKADESDEPSTPDDGSSTTSSQSQLQYHQFYSKYNIYNHQNHMDINFSGDVNQ